MTSRDATLPERDDRAEDDVDDDDDDDDDLRADEYEESGQGRFLRVVLRRTMF